MCNKWTGRVNSYAKYLTNNRRPGVALSQQWPVTRRFPPVHAIDSFVSLK